MKKILIYSLIFFMNIIFAQQKEPETNIEHLLQKRNELKNSLGSVNSYFTLKELKVLRDYLTSKNESIAIPLKNGSAINAYAPDHFNQFFGSFDLNDPSIFNVISTSSISNITDYEGAGAINPLNPNTAYALSFIEGDFYSIDITTGVYTLLGNIPNVPTENWNGLEFDPTDGTLYAISSQGVTATLSIIDIDNVTSTPIGNTGLQGGIALAIDGDGNMYSYALVDDNFYSIDKTTAVSTLIGPIGFDASFGQGMTWDPNTNQIYMSSYNNGNFLNELRTVNTSTGATTLIAPIVDGNTVTLGWLGIPNQPLSVDDLSTFEFNFFPNPVKDKLSLSALSSIDSITIYSITGQEIINKTINTNTAELNISNLNSGVFIMKVVISDKTGMYKIFKE